MRPAQALGRAAVSPTAEQSRGGSTLTPQDRLREALKPPPPGKQLNDKRQAGWDYFPLYNTRYLLKHYVIKKAIQVDMHDSFFLFALKMNKL